MTFKTTLHLTAIKSLIVDMVGVIGLIEAICPIDNKELASAITETYEILDVYAYSFFRTDAVALTNGENEESES